MPAYTFTDFHVPNSSDVDPRSINDSGEVVGYDFDSLGKEHGFTESQGVVTVIDVPGATGTNVTDVNASGEIVGNAFLGSSGGSQPFIDDGGTMQSIIIPGAASTFAYSINDAGQVAGYYTDANGTEHGYLYQAGKYITIDYNTNNSLGTTALIVNNAGEVAGTYEDSNYHDHYFVYNAGNFYFVNVPGAAATTITGMNNSGEVTGSFYDGVNTYGYVENNGTYTTFGVPGASYIQPLSINDAGEVAGYYIDGSQQSHGFVEKDGVVSVVDDPRHPNAIFYAINNAGEIAGYSDVNHITTPFTASLTPPSITGTVANQPTSGTAPLAPFATAVVADPNGGTETVTITLSGGGGALSGTGLKRNPDGSYTLSGSAAAVTGALEALTFTPAQNAPGTTTTTTFTLTDSSTAGTTVTDAGTSVVDTVPPLPGPTDAVSFDGSASFLGNGAFLFSGQATSTAGVAGVEIMANVDGTTTDLGAATLGADGTFTFRDQVGQHQQSAIEAVLTDGAGGKTTAAAPFVLTAGIQGQPFRAEQDVYTATGAPQRSAYYLGSGLALYHSAAATNADGSTSYTYSDGVYFGNKPFSAFTDTYGTDGTLLEHVEDDRDGSHTIAVLAPRQTVTSIGDDTIDATGQSGTTFAFQPGFGQDTVTGFQAAGRGHDTIALSSADFAGLGQVLRQTQDTAAGAVIHDRASGDTILVTGVAKADLFGHARPDVVLQA